MGNYQVDVAEGQRVRSRGVGGAGKKEVDVMHPGVWAEWGRK